MKLLSLKTLLLAMLAIAVLAPQAMAVDELGIYTANDGNSRGRKGSKGGGTGKRGTSTALPDGGFKKSACRF